MKNESVTPSTEKTESVENTSRRKFLGVLGKTAVSAAVVGTAVPFLDSKSSVAAQAAENVIRHPFPNYQRAAQCYQIRLDAARNNLQATSKVRRFDNSDENRYANKIGNYSKGLPHQSNGEVDVNAYNSMLTALQSGNQADFENITLGGDRKLINPQSGYAFDMEGADAFSFYMPPPPEFASREIAAEIAENYWMALLRDVPFSEYPNNPIAQAAAADLTLFDKDFKGAKNASDRVTPELLFRGLTSGDKAGPYISQFFYLPCFFGANEVNQRIQTVRAITDGGRDYMTDFASWLAVQNGVTPQNADIFDPIPRYIRSGRDIGQWVHIDVLFQAYFQAFLVIAGTLNTPYDEGNPYNKSATQTGFGTFGAPHIATLLCEVATRALKAVWNQKWLVHRRMRPEVFAERVDRAAFHRADYPVHAEILESVGSSQRLGKYLLAGNAFLPQAFPEGSPTHPSYGAGHATVAGACTTILKAWFDESAVIENPVVPDVNGQVLTAYTGGDTLTVGGELNKVASNVALGRNIAGVHWRSDGTESLKLGEAVAISVLRDHKSCFNEKFDGFSLTKFDGTTIKV
jgi:membrane-associated phospholipid phosphatase